MVVGETRGLRLQRQARLALMPRPPQDVPLARSRAWRAFLSNLKRTKPNTLCLPNLWSTGMEQSAILMALENTASSSIFKYLEGGYKWRWR